MKLDDVLDIKRRFDERALPEKGRHIALLGSQLARLIVLSPFSPDDRLNWRVASDVMRGEYGSAPGLVAGFTVHVVDDGFAVQLGEADQYPKAWIGT